jgi:inner membrane protein
VSSQVRFWGLIAIALASHLALDSLNSYGVHPFYPFRNTWSFGDAVFILEPWLWLILGLAVVWNGRTRAARLAAALPALLALVTLAFTGVLSLAAVGAFVVVGGASAWLTLRFAPHTRAAVAIVLSAVVIAAFIATSHIARERAIQTLEPGIRGHFVDVILTPNPSSLLCWAVIAIELRETAGEYVLWRGTMSLAPEWKAPTSCASHQFAETRAGRVIGDGRFALRDVTHQPLRRLRTLAGSNCWVRAWLRFGRAPVVEGDAIFDLRFNERVGQDFSRMRFAEREGCPSYVPDWGMPRADLLR